jgi:hypothetical protein
MTKKPAPPRARLEAELEALLSSALSLAFSSIPRDQFKHQVRFKVRLGHKKQELDGAWAWRARGRADIILFHQGRALAVVELKREDLALTDEDRDQGQSYANLLTPRPPLVILTNGKSVEVFDSGTGEPWSAGDDASAAVAKLLQNAATVAAAGMRWAVEALMGPAGDVWTKAVRDRTAHLIRQLTVAPGEIGKPFARDFHCPRMATRVAEALLKGDKAIVLVEGPPLIGKSSVLRELAMRTEHSAELAMLMLRGGSGAGLFQRIANVFSAELEWEVTADNVRQWLRRMSRFGYGPTLVLAIVGLEPGGAMAVDLEELADTQFGPKLRLIATTDDADALLAAANGRTPTAIAARAARLKVGPLDTREFKYAERALKRLRIGFTPGAVFADEYRVPWLLRSIYDRLARHPKYGDTSGGFLLPSSLGLQQIDATRAAYARQPDLLHGYRLIARDALADQKPRSPELSLAGAYAFVVQRDALASASEAALPQLAAQGWARTYRHAGGEDVVVPTAPEVFMSELSIAAGEELGRRAQTDGHAAGVWLGERFEGIFLGDFVGAQAIRDLAGRTGGFNWQIIQGLLSRPPRTKPVKDALIAFPLANGQIRHASVENGKARLANRNGVAFGPEIDLGPEQSRIYADTTPSMIVGQLARLPMAPVGDDHIRVDAGLLLEVGVCPFPLLRARNNGVAHLVHDLGDLGEVLCQDNGVIEPVTAAMAELLSRPWDHRDAWIAVALQTRSLPLLQRVMIALRAARLRSHRDCVGWANAVLEEQILPAIDELIEDGLKTTEASA